MTLRPTHHVTTFPGEGIPNDSVALTDPADAHQISVTKIDVEQHGEAVRFEAGVEEAVLGQHPGLQLDADERVQRDVVTESTVSVPVDRPVRPVDEAGVGLTQGPRLLVLVVRRTAGLHLVALALPGETLQGGRQERIKVTSVNHGDSQGVELHAPLALVELEVVQEEVPGDVAEPGVVPLQGGTLQPRLPELQTGLAGCVSVTDGTVVVLVGDARHCVGDWQGAHRVTGQTAPLTAGLHLPRAPVSRAGVSDVEVAVLSEVATPEHTVVLRLLFLIKVGRVNTAVAVLGTPAVTQTVPGPPVQLQRLPGVPASSAGVFLRAEFSSLLDCVIIPLDGRGGGV